MMAYAICVSTSSETKNDVNEAAGWRRPAKRNPSISFSVGTQVSVIQRLIDLMAFALRLRIIFDSFDVATVAETSWVGFRTSLQEYMHGKDIEAARHDVGESEAEVKLVPLAYTKSHTRPWRCGVTDTELLLSRGAKRRRGLHISGAPTTGRKLSAIILHYI